MSRKPKGKIFYGEIIDCGLHRVENQDAIYSVTKDDFGLFVLADGMGGHNRGEFASQEIVKACQEYYQLLQAKDKLPNFLIMVQEIVNVIRATNEKVYVNYSQETICGSTMVLLLIKNNCYAIFSVGDSRVYTYYQGELELLTIDDIWDNLPDVRNLYTEEQRTSDARHGKLIYAMGVRREVGIHVTTDRVKKGQCFLLCSDGVYRFCDQRILQEGMKHCFSESMVQMVLGKYKKEVYQNGAKDNFSAILVCVR